ncbi:penicillin-binding protein 2 [Algimonas porphyrae]|uniref:Peptidoglycan glycosyltransferase n=1 Tax=Algimonas porphyrae TaxID=1128113 RepID=A0ABQ5UVL8_9PROT|nr:penicillin-binding protein 2 [Algimonas porphyrae]GLQ19308.1 peptidoglycan glycosyltransferase [Algimonas porphyrae]
MAKSRKSRQAVEAKSDAQMTRRTAILALGGIGGFGIIGGRLYQLQIAESENYLALSEENRFNYQTVLPSRGIIRDRHGEPLASNTLDYRIDLVSEQIDDLDLTLKQLGDIINLSEGEIKRIRRDVKRRPDFVPVTVKDHVDWDQFAALNMRVHALPGIVPTAGEGRTYPRDAVFSHITGYVGKANDRDIERDDDPLLLQPAFRIGKVGVEQAMDVPLRGQGGRLKVEVNARGRVVREWPDPSDAATPGQDVWMTLDAPLQRFTAEQFGDDSGGIAVVDVMTGELRTLLSMPTYDANLFVSGLTQADMDALNNDERRPQYNKVLSGGYAPASTYKMAVMLAALESGLVDPDRRIFCGGKVKLGNRDFHCWRSKTGHGAMNMRDSLKQSCDTYYYEISQVIGIQAIADMARRLGLGQSYGLNIGGERDGIVPDPGWKRDRLGSGWRMGDTLNASIGQGFVLATPLQLAVMTARLANGSQAVSPSLYAGFDRDSFASLNIDPDHLRLVQDSMWSVCEEPGGTAFRPNGLGIAGLDMAGKTGTSQVRGISRAERATGVLRNDELPWKYRDHSLFVGYAPYDRPRFAVGCVVEHGGSGAGRAATIVRSVLGEALRRDGLGARTDAGAERTAL